MKSLLTAVCLFLQAILHAQQQKCDCVFLISPEYSKTIPVYDKPNGISIQEAIHDIKNESFLTGVIL